MCSAALLLVGVYLQNRDDASVIMARHSVDSLAQFGEQGTTTVNTIWRTIGLEQVRRDLNSLPPRLHCGTTTLTPCY